MPSLRSFCMWHSVLQWLTVVHKDGPARHKVDRQGQKHQETMPCAGPGYPHASAFGEWWQAGPEGGLGESRKEGARQQSTLTPPHLLGLQPCGLNIHTGKLLSWCSLARLEDYLVAIFSYTLHSLRWVSRETWQETVTGAYGHLNRSKRDNSHEKPSRRIY